MADLLRIKRDTAATWTSNNPTLAAGELGFETDTKLLKVGDGSTAWTSLDYLNDDLTTGSIGSQIQAYDADLTTIAGLTATSGNFIVGDAGNAWSSVSTSSAKTTLGFGTLADSSTVSDSDLSEDLAITAGGTGASDAATARTNLGLAIGTDVLAYDATYVETSDIGSTVQAYDSNLTSFVSAFTLPTSDGTANQILTTNGSGTLSFFSAGIESDTVADTDSLPVDSTVSDGDIYFVIATNQFAVYDGTDSAWKLIDMTELAAGWVFQGSNYGYASGGAPGYSNAIEKFSFASDGNATDAGDLTIARTVLTGQSSTTDGYTSGGYNPTNTIQNIIDKFPFSTDANATDVGDLTVSRVGGAGQSSENYGYTSGGGTAPDTNTIDKFPFSTDANATDVGDLTASRQRGTGQSSSTHGYTSGGQSPESNVIDKFPFTSDANATDVGNLTAVKTGIAGQSSSTHGYTTGGHDLSTIDKFPFSTDANATNIGDLTTYKEYVGGQSSTTSGYTTGGSRPAATIGSIEKFSFTTDANGTDVGDLVTHRTFNVGQQY